MTNHAGRPVCTARHYAYDYVNSESSRRGGVRFRCRVVVENALSSVFFKKDFFKIQIIVFEKKIIEFLILCYLIAKFYHFFISPFQKCPPNFISSFLLAYCLFSSRRRMFVCLCLARNALPFYDYFLIHAFTHVCPLCTGGFDPRSRCRWLFNIKVNTQGRKMAQLSGA